MKMLNECPAVRRMNDDRKAATEAMAAMAAMAAKAAKAAKAKKG